MKKQKAQATAAAIIAEQAHAPQGEQTTPNATTQADSNAAFTALVRGYEQAHASGTDNGELYALAAAVALSVVKKCVDPQRKAAAERETVSNSGFSPALVAVRRGIMADLAAVEKLDKAAAAAYAWHYNKNGDIVSEVVDKAAAAAVDALASETFSDGLDIVNAAAVAILEQAAEHAAAPGWMETPYKLRRLSRRVIIKDSDAAKWEEVDTTPIQEVYRAVRREVQASRAVQADPRNGYLYIEDTTADPDSDKMETIYRRLQKWADLGGETRQGYYTADEQTAADYNAVVEALNLTDRQATIVRLRMAGHGYKAIATYLGVDTKCVKIHLTRLQDKCAKMGFTPAMWAEMTGHAADLNGGRVEK